MLKFYLRASLTKTNIADFGASMDSMRGHTSLPIPFPQVTEDAARVTAVPQLCGYHRVHLGTSRLFQD